MADSGFMGRLTGILDSAIAHIRQLGNTPFTVISLDQNDVKQKFRLQTQIPNSSLSLQIAPNGVFHVLLEDSAKSLYMR